ncbi:MAG: N-6 DNA methylase, partial [Treponema sp.]|nr:N-6 DNA methylase [Treponema sp.]
MLGSGCKKHTPESMLSKKIHSFEDLKERFNIEVVTKEFYNELFKWYEWALKHVTFPSGDTTKNKNGKFNFKQSTEKNELNLIRLITRLMFVWFIKQKDLIPSWIFDQDELKKVLVDFDAESTTHGNYYNAIIQNLFFATLNKKIEDRAFADDKSVKYNKQFGVKTFYRDNHEQTFFKETHKKIIERFESVPFLNGGLFECLDELKDNADKTKNIQVFIDGFSREPERMAFVPNHLFWLENEGTNEGLIHILNRYNFTVEENTPTDVQIALDPELLGKVFENLLGTYNPETKDTARKSSGSFYTPRTVVNFMIDEALKNYLLENVAEMNAKQIAKLFDDNEIIYDENNADKVVNAIKSITVLDPACGSGAFPMGMLQRMVHLIQKSTDFNGDDEAIYQLKLELIENCLYGVDIQPIAVQICKLRFFISLICEQTKTGSKEDNYGFNPLPNLETKFVAADSLIGLKKENGMELVKFDEIDTLKNELSEIRKKHFKTSTAREKAECRKKDKEKRQEIVTLLTKSLVEENSEKTKKLENELENERKDLIEKIKNLPVVMIDAQEEAELFDTAPKTLFQKDKNEDARKLLRKQLVKVEKDLTAEKTKKSMYGDYAKILEKLVSWNPYDQNAVSTFFDAQWMFNIKDGFDVVIGNPPYIQLQDNKGKLADLYQHLNYKSFKRTGDIYQLFYERGIGLLKEKGHLVFITSNKWMRAGYGESSRKFFAENTQPKLLINLAGEKVFEHATVDVNILVVQKAKYEHETVALKGDLDCLEKRSDF